MPAFQACKEVMGRRYLEPACHTWSAGECFLSWRVTVNSHDYNLYLVSLLWASQCRMENVSLAHFTEEMEAQGGFIYRIETHRSERGDGKI